MFALSVGEHWLLYAPGHDVLALVTEKILAGFTGHRVLPKPRMLTQLADKLAAVPKRVPDIPTGAFDPRFLGIVPTRTCNFACRYCAFDAEAAREDIVDTEFFLTAVDWMAEQVVQNGGKTLRIDFFGGEPLMVPKTLETIIHYAHKVGRKNGLVPQSEIATNGFCSERRAHLIADHIDYIVLSLDGPSDIQDYHRPLASGVGSFATVAKNAEIMAAGHCRLAIRVCVTSATVSRVPEICRWLCRWLKPDFINFESLKPTPESEAAGIIPPDPWEFGRQLRSATRIAATHAVHIVQAAADINELQGSFCPVGKDVPIFCPDGEINACYLPRDAWKKSGLDFRMGNYTTNGQIHIDTAAIQRIREYTTHRNRCKKCFCRWHCAGGCHVAWHNLDDHTTLPPFCIQTRMTTIGRLLDALGLDAMADALMDNEKALKTLILKNSDALQDWNEEHAEID